MAVAGAQFGSFFGYDFQCLASYVNNAGPASTQALASLDAGAAFRFMATQTKDIKGVRVHWSSVSTPGQVRIRIETINTADGKPSGVYDAAAELLAQTPSTAGGAAGQLFSFAATPTTGLVVGNEYAVTIVTTTGGTTQTLSSSAGVTAFPAVVLTTADAGVTWTEASASGPIASLILEDDTEDTMGLVPLTSVSNNNVFGTAGVAAKIVIPSGITLTPAGIAYCYVKVGTPAGDLRLRIFDSGNSVVSNSTVTIDKDSLVTNASVRRGIARFGTLPSLTAGTYRIVADSASSANSSNCYNFRSVNGMSSAVIPSGHNLSTCPDVGTPVWTDTNTAMPALALYVDSIAGSGGGGGLAANPLRGFIIA